MHTTPYQTIGYHTKQHCTIQFYTSPYHTTAHLKKVHSEWCSKPLSEFGQKLAPASRRAANYTLISLLDDRRRHGDHILGTMHTKRGFIFFCFKSPKKNAIMAPPKNVSMLSHPRQNPL